MADEADRMGGGDAVEFALQFRRRTVEGDDGLDEGAILERGVRVDAEGGEAKR